MKVLPRETSQAPVASPVPTPVAPPGLNDVSLHRPNIARPLPDASAVPAPPAVHPVAPPVASSNQPAAPTAPPAAKKSTKSAKTKSASVFGGTNKETKEYIVENLSMLLNTGVTVGEALEAIAGELPKKSTQKLLAQMETQIDEGTPLWRAMEQTRLFTTSAIALVQVGEESGRLPENLKVIADQMHKSNQMSAKIRSAMLYPAFLIGLLFVVGTGVGVFLLPRLINVLKSLNVKVGLITRIVLSVGTFFGHYGLLVAGGVVMGTVVVVIAAIASPAVKALMQAIGFRIPGIKRLLFETELSRLGFVLGTLLEAGLPVETALQSASDSMATHRYRRFVENIRHSIEEGNSFAKTFASSKDKKLLPGTMRQLIVSAEKSGNLSASLTKVGQVYEDKADLTARNLETLLEPVILVIIAICVLFVALAVILPIYSLVGGLNNGR